MFLNETSSYWTLTQWTKFYLLIVTIMLSLRSPTRGVNGTNDNKDLSCACCDARFPWLQVQKP